MGAKSRVGPDSLTLPIRSWHRTDTCPVGGRTRGRTRAVGAIAIHVPVVVGMATWAVPTGGGKEDTDDGVDVFGTTKSLVGRDECPSA